MTREVVAGRRPALEAVRSGRVAELIVARSARPTPGLREVLDAAEIAGVAARRVSDEEMEGLAGGLRHQGVVALVDAPAELGESDLARRDWGARALVVVLDGVTDPQNLGAIARTTEAAGGSALVTRRHRAAPITPVAIRASAGALLHLPVARVANVSRAVGRLQEAGFWAVGLDGGAETSLADAEPSDRLALVAGAEGEGLSRLVREACDELVSIPLRGRVGSLNVSAAAAVAVFHYAMRQERGSPGKQE